MVNGMSFIQKSTLKENSILILTKIIIMTLFI